jgi:uncharacterized membrane protein
LSTLDTKPRLFEHALHPHVPHNVNFLHALEQPAGSFNRKLAVGLTRGVGSMQCAYLFTALAFVGLLGLLGWLNPFTFLFATWASQQFAQLVLLPVIMVGQNVLNRKQELQADEQYACVMKTFHDMEQVMQHLDAQDIKILELLEKVSDANGSHG